MQTAALIRGTQSQALPNLESDWVRGVSPATETLVAALENVAKSNAPVLIVGESGTGKSTLAAEIHRISGHQKENFRAVNCAEPDSDISPGWDGADLSGTVFFRNITEMSPNRQLKTFQAFFNGNRDGRASECVRVIGSSPRTLDEDVRCGRFREDLYYRISSFCLCVPPLRQRKEDVPLLAQHFAMKYSTLLGRPFEMSPQVLQLLSGYSWPGNIRELEHVVRTIVALGDESIALAIIRASGLKGISRDPKIESVSLKKASREASRRAERELILDTLSRTHWNRKRAARELQISYKALLYKLKQIGIDDDNSSGVEA
jgi:two-component system, NtrC family, response regulator AtoC